MRWSSVALGCTLEKTPSTASVVLGGLTFCGLAAAELLGAILRSALRCCLVLVGEMGYLPIGTR